MKGRMTGFLVLFLWSVCCLGTVKIHTTSRGIVEAGLGERAGTIRFELNGGDFFTASTCTPLFMRVRLDKGVAFAETLVDIRSPETAHVPINLVCVVDGQPGVTLGIEPDAIQIVRWREGETELWIRINSVLWVREDGQNRYPDEKNTVSFQIGISAERSIGAVFPYWETSRANLPGNQDIYGNPRHTFLMVCTEGSAFGPDTGQTPWPENELLFDTIAFDFNTVGVMSESDPRRISCGDGTPVNLWGDDQIAFLAEQETKLLLPHISPSDAPFQTEIAVTNAAPTSQPVAFWGYDVAGDRIGCHIQTVAPNAVWSTDAQTLFPGAEVSHMVLRHGSSIWASASYRPRWGDLNPAIVPEKRGEWTDFVVFPRDAAGTFDGLALVHAGDEPTRCRLQCFAADGRRLSENSMAELAPMNKQLILLGSVAGQLPAYVRISSDQPLAVMGLHGSIPGVNPGFLTDLPIDGAPGDAISSSSLRHIVQVTPSESTEATFLDVLNLDEASQSVHLTAFDQNGTFLDSMSLDVDPARLVSHATAEMFPNLPVSHIDISEGCSCVVSARYRDPSRSRDSLAFPACYAPSTHFTIPIVGGARSMAAFVNIGDNATHVTQRVCDALGVVLDETIGELPAQGQTTVDLAEIKTSFPDAVSLMVVSEESLCTSVLHQSPGSSSASCTGPAVCYPPAQRPAPKEPGVFVPDPFFRQTLLDDFDADGDGELRPDEIQEADVIDCSFQGLNDLTGLEYLHALTHLDCSRNRLTQLPGLSRLTGLQVLECDDNLLTTLPELEVLESLSTLTCANNQLGALPDLIGLSSLTLVDCSQNRLTQLPSLPTDTGGSQTLRATHNDLDAGDCPDILALQAQGVDVTATPLFDGKPLLCPDESCAPASGIAIQDPNFKALLVRFCDADGDGEISACEAGRVTQLDCSSEDIESLSGIQHFENLTHLDCSNNRLTNLYGLSLLSHLQELVCRRNQIAAIPDLRGLTELRLLDCAENTLAYLPALPQGLETLDCSHNELSHVRPVEACALMELDCASNRLTTLPNLPATLRVLSVRNNQLFQLPSMSHLENLRELDCAENQFVHLEELSDVTLLLRLDCSHNLLTTLPDLGSAHSLCQLDCSYNQITTLPDWTDWRYYWLSMDCSHNQITTLPPTPAINRMRALNLSHNQLRTLPDLSDSWIAAFDISYNLLEELTGMPHPNWFPAPCIYARGNDFGPDDCPAIDEITNWVPLDFVYNPQADGTILECFEPE